jgi:phosphoribosyl 1,2-cyclic phosphodiesterase
VLLILAAFFQFRYKTTPSSGEESLLRVCLLASGSKGNAVYIESSETRILIDAGLSALELRRRLAGIGVSADDLHAILVTHEHGDHCRGVGVMARRHRIPVYLHPATRCALPLLGVVPDLREFEVGQPIALRDLQIYPFQVTHDAAAPVGFTIDTPEGKVGLATDLGLATRLVAEHLKNCRVLVLEANHDEKMLLDGPYPWHLKQRIRGHHGHLSNTASAQLLGELLWTGMEAVFLAHLSEVNNLPALADTSARQVIAGQNTCQPSVIVGSQEQVSFCVNL